MESGDLPPDHGIELSGVAHPTRIEARIRCDARLTTNSGVTPS